ncbi:hypothetical protein [Streptomyces sp. NPDC000888]
MAPVRAPAFSLSDAVVPALRTSAFSTGGVLNGFNTPESMRSVMAPHITGLVMAVNSAVDLSGVARCLQPLGELDAFG